MLFQGWWAPVLVHDRLFLVVIVSRGRPLSLLLSGPSERIIKRKGVGRARLGYPIPPPNGWGARGEPCMTFNSGAEEAGGVVWYG